MRHSALCLLALGCLGCMRAPEEEDSQHFAETGYGVDRKFAVRPNIVIIMTDDQDLATSQSSTIMPNLHALISAQGVTFNNYYTTYPSCSPSRATLLTGKHPLNHQILANEAPLGGFVKFAQSGLEQATLGTWLQSLGYRTGFYGKYINSYGLTSPYLTYVPPGWDDWAGGTGFLNYDLIEGSSSDGGEIVPYGKTQENYSTDVFTRKAVSFIERADVENDSQPFLIYLMPSAPHTPATVADRHEAVAATYTYPRGDAFDEDTADKPNWVRAFPALSSADKLEIDTNYAERVGTLMAVDEMVAALVETLKLSGELDRTYIFFTSDNGFHLGEHRLRERQVAGKRSGYETDIHLPLMIRGPGIAKGITRDHWALNTDLAATVMDLVGGSAPGADGMSLVPILKGEPIAESEWRQDFLVVNRYSETDHSEFPDSNTIRSGKWKYIVSGSGQDQFELYDMEIDPDELNNIYTPNHPEVAVLKARMEALKLCEAGPAPCWD